MVISYFYHDYLVYADRGSRVYDFRQGRTVIMCVIICRGHWMSFRFVTDDLPDPLGLVFWASVPQASGEIWCLPADKVESVNFARAEP